MSIASTFILELVIAIQDARLQISERKFFEAEETLRSLVTILRQRLDDGVKEGSYDETDSSRV